MRVLIELIAGFVALLAAFALAQFGVDLGPGPKSDREIQRVLDCGDETAPGQALLRAAPAPSRNC